MCQQKTDARLFLEEYCKKFFPNRSYEIVPYHYFHTGTSQIEQDERVFYFGDLTVADPVANDITYFGKYVPYVNGQKMFFSSLGEFTDISFFGYMVTFEVSLNNGEIK